MNKEVMKKYTVMVIAIVFLNGCSSLTKTQTKAINQYFQTANTYSKYPIQVNKALAHIKLNRSQLYPESFNNDSIMTESLIQSLNTFKREIGNQTELNLMLNEFDHYIKDYYLIIPNGLNILKILESTSVTIAGFFGLNRVVSTAFSNIRSVKISPKKAKKIKAHISKGNNLADKTNIEVNKYITNSVRPKILEEKSLLKQNFKLFLQNIDSSQNSYNYYSQYNRVFTEQYMLILNTELLAEKLITVSNQMSIAQKKLNSVIENRQKLNKNVYEIQELYINVNELNKIMAQFETLN